MLSRRLILPVLVMLFAGLAGTGCGKTKTYPVEGRVTYPDGAPLVGATVEFESEGGEAMERLNARGVTDSAGAYKLTTFKEGDGAIEGKHRVIVIPPQYAPGNMDGPAPKEVLHSRFRKYEDSGLSYTVKPESNTYNITVQKP